MRRLVFALLFGLVLVPLPVHAQSVTLTVCNMGKVDIDVFVSLSNSHIRPATCVAVAESSGAMEPAYVGLAFTDARGQWGAARRFDGVPYMGVKNFPVATIHAQPRFNNRFSSASCPVDFARCLLALARPAEDPAGGSAVALKLRP